MPVYLPERNQGLIKYSPNRNPIDTKKTFVYTQMRGMRHRHLLMRMA